MSSTHHPFQRPEDDPERKKKDLKLALVSGISVIVIIALVVAGWVYLL